MNAGFYEPAPLARDVAAIDLTEHRFELGLGTGYVKEEFEMADLTFPGPRWRVDHLEHMAC